MRTIRRMSLAMLALMLSTLTLAGPVFAQDSGDVALDSPIRSLLLDPSETRVDLDIDLFNTADTRRIVNFELVGRPENWDIDIWNAFFDFRIAELVVEPTENTPGQRPRMRVQLPNPRPAPGDYSFTLILTDAQRPSIEYDRATFTIGVPEGDPEEVGAVNLSADFPVLRGPANNNYEFEVIIKNDTQDDHSFTMVGAAVDESGTILPGNWEIGFTPAFGEQKLISTVAIRAAIDERVNVQVTPPLFTEPGEYKIAVVVISGDETLADNIELTLEITGKGDLIASTTSGRLSMDATAGEMATNKLRLNNVGSGGLKDIQVTSNAPADWGVEYTFGRTIESLPSGEMIDWDVEITPPDDAIPGDYEITLTATGQNTTDSVALRVTVSQSTIWGWLGIVLVIAVVGALMGLFWRLGRR